MSMSIDAWNEYLKTFINELCETFPECPELFTLPGAIDAMISDDPYSAMEEFVSEIEPHTDALTRMDEQFFLTGDIDFLKKLGAHKYWTPDLEEETKQAIWQYLQTLLVMAKTIQNMDPDALRKLEAYANKVMAEMGSGELDPNNIDLQQLGMGAMRHMATGGSDDNNTEGSMFSNMFGTMSADQQADVAAAAQQVATQFGLNPIATNNGPVNINQAVSQMAHAASGQQAHVAQVVQAAQQPGGLDALLNQFCAPQGSVGPGVNIWAPQGAQPPLHGNHPVFQPPRNGSK